MFQPLAIFFSLGKMPWLALITFNKRDDSEGPHLVAMAQSQTQFLLTALPDAGRYEYRALLQGGSIPKQTAGR